MKKLGVLVAFATVMSALSGATALAQDPGPGQRGHVIVLPTEILYGRVPQPGALYVLRRAHGQNEVVDLRTSFTREIVRSVNRQPF